MFAKLKMAPEDFWVKLLCSYMLGTKFTCVSMIFFRKLKLVWDGRNYKSKRLPNVSAQIDLNKPGNISSKIGGRRGKGKNDLYFIFCRRSLMS